MRVGSGLQTDATTPNNVGTCSVHRGKDTTVSLCKPSVMNVRGPNNVGRAVQTGPALLRYAAAITEHATKGFKHRRESPRVPTITGPFPNGQANAGSWLGTKKCFVLLCPIGEQFLPSHFREFVHDGYCPVHSPSFPNQKRRNYR